MIEGDVLSRRNNQFQDQERNWKSYQNLEMKIPANAFPEPLSSGVTYLSFTEISENSSKSVSHLIDGAAEEFELIIIDLPRHLSEFTNSLTSKITMLNLIGVSGIESVRSLNRLRKSSLNVEISNLYYGPPEIQIYHRKSLRIKWVLITLQSYLSQNPFKILKLMGYSRLQKMH